MSAPAALLVVGDALLDHDLCGRAERLAPDAPVPVVSEARRTSRPGGAALAAVLAAADGRPVTLVTALGEDEASATLERLLAGRVRLVRLPLTGTLSSKTRVLAEGIPLLRLDDGEGRAREATDEARRAVAEAGAILVSDYGRGTAGVLREALSTAAGRVPVVWDPHPRGEPPVPGTRLVTPSADEARDFAARWGPVGIPGGPGDDEGPGGGQGPDPAGTTGGRAGDRPVQGTKPNDGQEPGPDSEFGGDPGDRPTRGTKPDGGQTPGADSEARRRAGAGLGTEPGRGQGAGPDSEAGGRRGGGRGWGAGGGTELRGAARDAEVLLRAWRVVSVVVTLGGRGALLSHGETPLLVPSPVTAEGDACGAGDRFAATAAGLLADGELAETAVRAAVHAATRYVAEGGVRRLDGTSAPRTAEAEPADDALRTAARVRAAGGTVVAAGGCFDLLHAGHVALLQAARRTGDCLVVCVNSDASVRRRKGGGRPLVPAADRIRVLRALECVDAVAVFDEDTPERLLAELRPHIWAKGGDYALERLPEATLVESWGGQVVLFPYLDGRSTTRIAERAAGPLERRHP